MPNALHDASTGAVVYCQAPPMAHVNDDPGTWAAPWRAELAVGAVPYCMFVACDTGPHAYFEVPLDRAWGPGKVVVDFAESRPDGDRVLQLRFLQARDSRLVGRPFRARMRDGPPGFTTSRCSPRSRATSGPR